MGIRRAAMESAAFEKLKEIYDHREKQIKAWREAGKKVIGELGSDVPDELILAGGMMPVRVYADPDKKLTLTDQYLEFAFEPVVRAQFEKLIDGTYKDQIDALAISNSTDVIIRIFLYLREIKRVEPEMPVPPIAFIDWLFTRNRLHQERDRFVIRLFRKEVEAWAGRKISDEEIREAGKILNENRQALREMAELRHGNEVRISGSEALVIIGAGLFMDKKEHTELVRQVTKDAASWPVLTGKRIFFTGANQEDTKLYDLIEEQDMVVVGEDTDWGDRHYDRDFNLDYPVIDAIVDRYMLREFSAKKAFVSQRVDALDRETAKTNAEAVIFYTNQYDEVATFDMPEQRKMLEKKGLRHITFGKMLWPADKNEGIREKLKEFADSWKGEN